MSLKNLQIPLERKKKREKRIRQKKDFELGINFALAKIKEGWVGLRCAAGSCVIVIFGNYRNFKAKKLS